MFEVSVCARAFSNFLTDHFCEKHQQSFQFSGLGGGFNERENVEYRSYDSDDDEFDKFGRRKKHRSKGDERSNSESDKNQTNKVTEKHDKSEIEESEEDEDDDDDLVRTRSRQVQKSACSHDKLASN